MTTNGEKKSGVAKKAESSGSRTPKLDAENGGGQKSSSSSDSGKGDSDGSDGSSDTDSSLNED